MARSVPLYYLFYTGVHQPARIPLNLPEDQAYQIDLIDPWEMSISRVAGVFRGKVMLPLPGKPYLALQVQKA